MFIIISGTGISDELLIADAKKAANAKKEIIEGNIVIHTRFGIGYDFKNNFGLNFRVIPGVINMNSEEYDSYTDRNFVAVLRGTYTLPGKNRKGSYPSQGIRFRNPERLYYRLIPHSI